MNHIFVRYAVKRIVCISSNNKYTESQGPPAQLSHGSPVNIPQIQITKKSRIKIPIATLHRLGETKSFSGSS